MTGPGARPTAPHRRLSGATEVDFVDESRALTEEDLHAACDGTDGSLLKALGLALRRMHETPVPEELEAAGGSSGGVLVGVYTWTRLTQYLKTWDI